jgi:hypothetical protein
MPAAPVVHRQNPAILTTASAAGTKKAWTGGHGNKAGMKSSESALKSYKIF